VVVFSFCLFIVVYGVKNAGLVESLEKLLSYVLEIPLILQIFSVGIFSSFLASSINNLPSVMLGDLALRETSNFLIFSHLLGCNIGAKLTPIGSLATLLWLSSLRRYGVRISFLYYMKIAFLVTIPTLLFSLFSLSIFL
ncbi:MAG: ArsB/NhaD family transporter, partial [Helicobacter sp.]|nr:ArsB/NhaD family transporter [Helicobacter sp.]